MRTCFIPSAPNRRLIVSDYSQIELCIAGCFAKDQAMLAAFRAREDLHRKTASTILSKPLVDVTGAYRQLAKAVNFGFLYGQSAEGFQLYALTQFGISLTLEEATKLREKFFEQFKGLARWHQEAWQQAESVSEARTILGRRLLPRSEKKWHRFNLLTAYVVSGSAADVLKVAMVKLASILPSDAHLVATVHDELILDVPQEQAIELCDITRTVMEDAFKGVFPDLPIEVEAKVCANWGEK